MARRGPGQEDRFVGCAIIAAAYGVAVALAVLVTWVARNGW